MIRQITVLLSGNALSQLVNVFTILFVVTTYYLPTEFGRYAVLMSYVGILSSVTSLRYELGIVSIGGSRRANNLVFLSVFIATAFALFAYIVISAIAAWFGNGFLLGVSPVAIVALAYLKAIDQIIASILYRNEAYLRYSLLKLLQALVLLFGFWISGASGQGLNGLLGSMFIAYAAFGAAGLIVVRDYRLRVGVRLKRMALVLKRNSDFVKFNTPQALIDNFLANGLNIVLIGIAGSSVVGYFNFLHKLLKAPLGLIFGSISQVVFRFSAKNVGSPGQVVRKLGQVLVMTTGLLFGASVVIGLLYVYFAELEFLKDWDGLRDYMIAFSVWMLVPFFFSPFATLPVVYGHQKTFFFAATSFNLVSLAVIAFLSWSVSVNAAFWTVGLASVVYYAGIGRWAFGIAGYGQKS